MRIFAAAIALLCTTLGGVAGAEEPRFVGGEITEKSMFRGSRVTYRNSVTAISFDESAELTYDPTYVMTLGLGPRWWFADQGYLRAGLTVGRELTESNWTTESGETYLGDTTVAVGSPMLWKAPVIGTTFSAELGLRFPSSKASQARTLLTAIEPRVGVRRTFGVLSGIWVGYGMLLARDFHEFTTAQRESSLIPGACDVDASCARHLNSGVRNTTWRMSHTLDAGIAFTDWLSLGGAFGVHAHYLHPASEIEDESFEPLPDENARYFFSYDLEATVTPWRPLVVGLGASTFNEQLAPDSTFRAPVFNRFTQVYLDLRLDVAELFVSEG